MALNITKVGCIEMVGLDISGGVMFPFCSEIAGHHACSDLQIWRGMFLLTYAVVPTWQTRPAAQ